MSARPLSIVTASGAGGGFLFRCLASLYKQALQHQVELIVVDRCGPETRSRLERDFPEVTTLAPELGHRPSVPELRRIGIEAAEGEIVAVIEEHCVAPPHWVETILSSMSEDTVAVGGPILHDDYQRLRDWVVYFSEYHNYMPPWPEGERLDLNGANIAYRRDRLLEHRAVLDTGWWEAALHPRLAKQGRFLAVQEMGVRHTGPFDYGYYLRQRYLLSRVWGGTQRQQSSLSRRLIHLAAAPVFPLFLLARITRRVIEKGKLIGRYLLTLPLLGPVLVAYTWGEWLGYLVGSGDALEEVE